MLAILIPSDAAGPPRTWAARVASTAVHGAVIALAAAATQAPPPDGGPDLHAIPVIYSIPGSVPARPMTASLPGLPQLPGLRLPTVFDIPSSIPLPQLAQPGAVAAPWTDPWTGAPGLPGDSGTGAPGAIGLPLDARTVEEPPALLTHPAPRYPEVLRQAGIEGTVLVEAVLDTLGRVEPASLRIARGAHALFEAEATAVVRASHYRPGRMGTRAVRVRILVPVGFTLRR